MEPSLDMAMTGGGAEKVTPKFIVDDPLAPMVTEPVLNILQAPNHLESKETNLPPRFSLSAFCPGVDTLNPCPPPGKLPNTTLLATTAP